MWPCARSPNVEAFTIYMESVKNKNLGAHDWKATVPTHHWSRSHFTTVNKCDILLSNMCEFFKRSIIFARQRGILVMLEMIREYLMKSLQNKIEKCQLCGDVKITPKRNKLIEKFRKWSGGCYYAYVGYNQFEISTVSGNKFSINLNIWTCACRRWDLNGISCHHVICAMNRISMIL